MVFSKVSGAVDRKSIFRPNELNRKFRAGARQETRKLDKRQIRYPGPGTLTFVSGTSTLSSPLVTRGNRKEPKVFNVWIINGTFVCGKMLYHDSVNKKFINLRNWSRIYSYENSINILRYRIWWKYCVHNGLYTKSLQKD